MEMVIENINTITTLQDFNDYRNLLLDFEPLLTDVELGYFDQLILTSLRQSSNQFFWNDTSDITIKDERTGEIDIDSLEHLLNDYRKNDKIDVFEKKKKEGKDLRFFIEPEFVKETTNNEHWIDKLKNSPSLRSFGNLTSGIIFGLSDSFNAKYYFDPEVNKSIKDEQALQGYLKDAYEGILAEQLLALDNPVATGYVEWSKNVRKAIDSQSWWITGVSNTLTEIAKAHDSFFGPNNAYSALFNVTNQAWTGTINLTKDLLDVTNTSVIMSGRSRPLRKAVVTSMTAPGYDRQSILKALGQMGKGGDSSGAFGTKGKVEEKTNKETDETEIIVRKGAGFVSAINLSGSWQWTVTKISSISKELCDLVTSPDFQSQFFIAFFTVQTSLKGKEIQLSLSEGQPKPINDTTYTSHYNYYFYTNKFKTKPAKRKQETLQYGAFKVKKTTNTVEGGNEFSFEVIEDIYLSLRNAILDQGLGSSLIRGTFSNRTTTPIQYEESDVTKLYTNLHILLPNQSNIKAGTMEVHHFILQDIQFTKVSSLKFDHSNTDNSKATISGICRKILLCSEDLETLYKRYK